VLFAGQISGVEGYVESIASGQLAGMNAAALARGREPISPARTTAFGSLIHYICHADPRNFQPANITFDLLPSWEQKMRDKKERHRLQCERALHDMDDWLTQACFGTTPAK
jgi:methylenetetrahydrofolate--tRNA-(uracil-5-)-methyltransferase